MAGLGRGSYLTEKIMTETEEQLVARLKAEMQAARLTAEKAAWAYFCACPVGPERTKAHEIYSNILYATRG
jgi:hypothetical protein